MVASFSSLVETIKEKITLIVTTINDNFDSIITTVRDKLDFVVDNINDIPNKIGDKLDYLFNPNNSTLEGDFATHTQTLLKQKFGFIESFKLALGNFVVDGRPLDWKINFMGQEYTVISSGWYEPYNPYIKGGLSVVFWVYMSLSCFRLISNIFGMSIGVGVSSNASSGGKKD